MKLLMSNGTSWDIMASDFKDLKALLKDMEKNPEQYRKDVDYQLGRFSKTVRLSMMETPIITIKNTIVTTGEDKDD